MYFQSWYFLVFQGILDNNSICVLRYTFIEKNYGFEYQFYLKTNILDVGHNTQSPIFLVTHNDESSMS